jgi:hypothetical protein
MNNNQDKFENYFKIQWTKGNRRYGYAPMRGSLTFFYYDDFSHPEFYVKTDNSEIAVEKAKELYKSMFGKSHHKFGVIYYNNRGMDESTIEEYLNINNPKCTNLSSLYELPFDVYDGAIYLNGELFIVN